MKRKIFILFIACLSTINIKASTLTNSRTDSTKLYSLVEKSKNIETVHIKKRKGKDNKVSLLFGQQENEVKNEYAVANGMLGKTESKEKKEEIGPQFDNIKIISGGYMDIKVVKYNTTQNLYTLKDVVFPLHLKMYSGKEFIEFELKEPGTWDIDVIYKNN